MANKNNDTYKAVFTLTQEGLNGEVYSTLEFTPLVDKNDLENVPPAYELMAGVVENFLFNTGIIDEDGELIDPAGFEAQVEMNVSTMPSGRKLN